MYIYDVYELKDFYYQSNKVFINHDDACCKAYVRWSQERFIANLMLCEILWEQGIKYCSRSRYPPVQRWLKRVPV